MRKLWIAAILAALALTLPAAAADLPPGKWWRRPEIIQILTLTDDQQNRLETIFRGAANDLIDLRGEVEKQNVALRGELDQPQLNRQIILRDATHLNEARGKLFERELMMLVDMRAVLTEPQWNRMRNMLERMNRAGQGMDGQGQGRQQNMGPRQRQQRP